MGPRKAVVDLLMRLGELFPGFNPTADTVAAWNLEIGHYTDTQIEAAGRMVARTHTYGPPAVSHIIEAIEGRIETVLEPNLDYGLVTENGRPMLQSKQVRVFPDGTREPLRIEERRRWNELEPHGNPPMALGDIATELLNERAAPDPVAVAHAQKTEAQRRAEYEAQMGPQRRSP